jgi:excisionase family DNA binding protein
MLTVFEAAKALRVSRTFMYRLIAARLIRHERFGRAIRIPIESVEEYRQSRTVAVVSESPPRPRKSPSSDLRKKHGL